MHPVYNLPRQEEAVPDLCRLLGAWLADVLPEASVDHGKFRREIPGMVRGDVEVVVGGRYEPKLHLERWECGDDWVVRSEVHVTLFVQIRSESGLRGNVARKATSVVARDLFSRLNSPICLQALSERGITDVRPNEVQYCGGWQHCRSLTMWCRAMVVETRKPEPA